MGDLHEAEARALAGGPERHRTKAAQQGKLPVRERVALLLDDASFSEEALLANWQGDGLGADGVLTGVGAVEGRPVALMANDPTVKAGSWGPKTVEKILRIQERAASLRIPMVYLVDSAGARITEQVQMFPGRRGAGRIFFNQVRMSGVVPQVCVLFGPSAAGGAYIPAFCDIVIMRDGNASMYLGSPRMAQMVIGEDVTLDATMAWTAPGDAASRSSCTRRCTPRKVNSSSTVQAMTSRLRPCFSRTARAKAPSMAAIPPFTSQGPGRKAGHSRCAAKGLNGHVVGGDGVLVDLEDQG